MFTDFNTLSDQSRIWIYQAKAPFTAQQLAVISAKCKAFINAWTRHGDDLKGSFTIKYNQFLILAVDESFNSVSGCSIDSSVHFIQDLETELKLSLLDKMQVSFKDNASVNLVSLTDFKNYAQAKKITKDTVVFNNLITKKADLKDNWEVPAAQSWHKRFLN